MVCSLSNVVNNLSEGIHRIRCKYGHDDKKYQTCRIKYKYCDCFLQYKNFKDDLIEYKCLCCNKNYQQEFDEKLKKQFLKTSKFSNHDKNKFIILLKRGIYPQEYINNYEKFNVTTLPEKEVFYSHFNMEDNTDADYAHPKRIFKDFEIKNLGEYHKFYV